MTKSKSSAKRIEEFINIDYLENTLAVKAACLLKQLGIKMAASKASRKVQSNELFATLTISMTKAHLEYTMVYIAKRVILGHKFTDLNCRERLLQLL